MPFAMESLLSPIIDKELLAWISHYGKKAGKGNPFPISHSLSDIPLDSLSIAATISPELSRDADADTMESII
jgi:hypothetical protein